MNFRNLKKTDRATYDIIQKELNRQRDGLELIASENFASPAVMEAMGSYLTNKYAEGYPDARYYGGCQFVDELEKLAIERARRLFNAEYANVQPHSGSQANMAVYQALLKPGDTILSMDLKCGGHLTHGNPFSFSGKLYNIISYDVDKNGYIDYDLLDDLAMKNKPKLIIAGASAYPRNIDFARIRKTADSVKAYFMVDMAHIAGIVAAGLCQNPVEYADVVTSTTHKTLRGPRGGLILCKNEFAPYIRKAVFPGVQGGPLMHVIAAKAVCFGEALKPEFRTYQKNVLNNTKVLANELMFKYNFHLVSEGTDNHLILIDLTSKNITGKELENRLDSVGITVNKNAIPHDIKPTNVTSGIRIGTPAVTSRGLGASEMKEIAKMINYIVEDYEGNKDKVAHMVQKMCKKFPLYKGVR